MISLKRNSKLELIPATGKRSRSTSIYTPGQSEDFRISRGRFDNFLTCPKCFYLDRVVGLSEPGTPGWSLNSATDELLKKEFDDCREKQIPHRLFKENDLDHLVPFKHEKMDEWRDSLTRGLTHRFEDSNIILSGGVDDIWFNTLTSELIVVDYKSQASSSPVTTDDYLTSPYHQGYKTQMDFYNYLLTCMGFKVAPISYFLVVNVDKSINGFFGNMKFTETLVPYSSSITWIPEKIRNMIALMNQENVPNGHESCENCAYARERANYEEIK